MRLPGRCALHAVATVTAASLLIATLAYKERDATAAAVNPSIDVGHMNALCVVGEWRTFAMPAVYNSVVNAARVWDADSFMFYHTRYDLIKILILIVKMRPRAHSMEHFSHPS